MLISNFKKFEIKDNKSKCAFDCYLIKIKKITRGKKGKERKIRNYV